MNTFSKKNYLGNILIMFLGITVRQILGVQTTGNGQIIGNRCKPSGAKAAIAGNQKSGNIGGSVKFYPSNHGNGVGVHVKVHNLPDGLHAYHVHQSPIAGNNNDCSTAGDHFDPNFGFTPCPPPPADPAFCQLGDLSGKFGLLQNADGKSSVELNYTDPKLAFKDVIGKSIVIHADNSRIACGTIVSFHMVNGREVRC